MKEGWQTSWLIMQILQGKPNQEWISLFQSQYFWCAQDLLWMRHRSSIQAVWFVNLNFNLKENNVLETYRINCEHIHWKPVMQSKRLRNSLQSCRSFLIHAVWSLQFLNLSQDYLCYLYWLCSLTFSYRNIIFWVLSYIQPFIFFHLTKFYQYLTTRTFLWFGTSGLVMGPFWVIQGHLIDHWIVTIHTSQVKSAVCKQVKAMIFLSQKLSIADG